MQENNIKDKLIYSQRAIPKDQYRYGFRSSAKTGCGWIATYNALCLLNKDPDIHEIISFYEHELPLINGNIGTFMLSPVHYFQTHGYEVYYTGNKNKFDDLAKASDVSILFFWWRYKFMIGPHFVALHEMPNGYYGYNTYANSKGPDYYGKSIKTFLAKKHYFGAILIGIKRKD